MGRPGVRCVSLIDWGNRFSRSKAGRLMCHPLFVGRPHESSTDWPINPTNAEINLPLTMSHTQRVHTAAAGNPRGGAPRGDEQNVCIHPESACVYCHVDAYATHNEQRQQVREELRCMICFEILKESTAIAEVRHRPIVLPIQPRHGLSLC